MHAATRKLLGVGAVLVAGSLVGATASAIPAGPAPGRAMARAARAAFARLDLSEQQRQQIRAIREQYRPALESLRDQARSDRMALRAAMGAQAPDPAAVGNAALKVRQDREAVRTQMKSVHEAVLGVLTTEQRAQLKGYMEAWRDLHRRPPRD